MSPRRFVLSLVLLWLLIVALLHLHAPEAGAADTTPTRAADSPPARPDLTIDAATRSTVIEGVAQKLESRYVFPDVGKKIAASLRSRGAKTRYGGITSAAALCESLTAELRSISKDLHLRVDYAVQPKPMPKPDEEPTPEQAAARLRDGAAQK
jgi:hypothetical protein